MRFGSLFTGIGGMDLGLERAGMSVAWQVEADPYCQRVLAKHWPTVRRYGDICEVSGEELERVDLIAGGFPCQPVSVAGKRLGRSDTRWLWPEFIRLVRVVRPSYVFVENVSGLYQRGLTEILTDLAESGYGCEWDSLSTGFMFGHYRPRLFLVAFANGAGLEGRVFSPTAWEAFRVAAHRDWGVPTSRVLRKADGLPHRVDRLKGLGNACVPQVVEWIGRQILTQAPSFPPSFHSK